MLTEAQINSPLRDYSSHHYLSRSLAKVALPPFWRAILGGLAAYLVFLIFAAVTEWQIVINSFLHVWQITFSVTIFFGLWLGTYALNDLKEWLQYIGRTLPIDENDYVALANDTCQRLGSGWSFIFALPFILGGMGVAFTIAQNSPNSLFPFPGSSPVFIYSIFFELCFLMLHLLGATGFWTLYTFTQSARKLSQLPSIDYTRIDQAQLKPLSNAVLRLCFYLLVIIASAMPGVAFVVFSFGNFPPALLFGAIFGMVLPTVALTLSFFGPVYYLHHILVKAKETSIARFKEQIRICEDALFRRLTKLSLENTPHTDKNEDLIEVLQFLRERLKEVQNESDWPFDFYSLLRLSGSALLPVAAFFAEQTVRLIFP